MAPDRKEEAMEGDERPRRGRRIAAVAALVAALAAVPAGVALAGDSNGSGGDGASTVQDGQGRDRGHDRGDCPEKDRGGQSQQEDSTQL
jgi:hypothetical protein